MTKIALPVVNGHAVQITPDVVALEETYDATISSSTSLTLNASTTFIEVSAIDKGIFLKWGGTASSTDFDEFIAPNSTRQYYVPPNASTGALHTTVQFIEESATAKLVVIEK